MTQQFILLWELLIILKVCEDLCTRIFIYNITDNSENLEAMACSIGVYINTLYDVCSMKFCIPVKEWDRFMCSDMEKDTRYFYMVNPTWKIVHTIRGLSKYPAM